MCCSRAAKLCMKIGKWYYKLVVTAAATTTTTPATPQQLSRPRTDNNNSLEILLWLKRHITLQLMLAHLDAVSDFNGTSARNCDDDDSFSAARPTMIGGDKNMFYNNLLCKTSYYRVLLCVFL